jgi:uncharacterized protein (DUF58 family)
MAARLTERGGWVAVLAGLTLVPAVWWRYPGLVAVGAGLGALVLLALASAAVPGRMSARREIEPLQVPRYGRCVASLAIVHHGRWWAATVDGAEPVGDGSVPITTTWLRPGRQVRFDYDVPTQRRGRLRVGPVRLRRRGLAGLAARTSHVGGTAEVRVLPRVLPVRSVPPGARRGHIGADERVAHGGTDLVGLREYLPGDDLRRLHWATSARTGTLMVRDDADPSLAHLAVVLDDREASYRLAAVDPRDAFEEAVDTAASLAGAASAAGHPVRLRSVSGRLDVELPGATAGAGRPAPELLAALADVALADSGPAEITYQPGDLDVLALVTGTAAEVTALVLEASRAIVGVVLVVDPHPPARVQPSESVLVLRAPRAEDLLRSWDDTVAGGGRWR